MMSKCPKCESFQFEMVENSPTNSRNKVNFVQCSKCGTPIGAMEYFVNWEKSEQLEKKVKELENKMDVVISLLDDIQGRIR